MAPAAKSTGDQRMLTEIPNNLKQLVRLVVRGFNHIEDALIIDMLLRNLCMKEEDMCELLCYERKQIRARISSLRMEKFLQVRLKMETGPDGKAAKVNYYYINYKTFVNICKYKLDMSRKRLETEERDATSRASFLCPRCRKTFTDLEADQLLDFETGEFHCTFCGHMVEEDQSAMPKKDSRLQLAKFNGQLQPLYDLLREVEDIKLSPECLEPEPTDLDTIRGLNKHNQRGPNEQWSGEATRNQGFAAEETRVDINMDGDDAAPEAVRTKDRPIWMTESTVVSSSMADGGAGGGADGGAGSSGDTADAILHKAAVASTAAAGSLMGSGGGRGGRHKQDPSEDIMQMLLQNERQPGKSSASQNAVRGLGMGAGSGVGGGGGNSSDSSDDEKDIENAEIPDVDYMSSDDEDDIPIVHSQGRPFPINSLTEQQIHEMTKQERDTYIQIYQEHYDCGF